MGSVTRETDALDTRHTDVAAEDAVQGALRPLHHF